MNHWLVALMLTAGTVGALHSLAPDHWLPFAALARARQWTPLRTARLAFLCGFGHVTVSALFGVIAVMVGHEAITKFGTKMQTLAPLLLIAFGLAYMIWGIWRFTRQRMLHQVDHINGVAHDHGHGHHHHHKPGISEWGLFLLFCADPCVAVIPMMVAAFAGGWGAVLAVVVVYEVATIAAINILVYIAHSGARQLRFAWVDRYGDILAGAMILAVGAFVTLVGI